MKACYANNEIAWELINHSVVRESTGELGVLEFGKELDFDIKRVFYLRGIEKGAVRGEHSHLDLKQVVVCLNGEFTMRLDNGQTSWSHTMKPNGEALFLDGKVWRVMDDFKENTVLMVLCDREYKYDQVVRDRSEFLKNLIGVNRVL